MRHGKAIGSKAFELAEQLGSIVLFIPIFDHAIDHHVVENRYPACFLEGGDAATKHICLGGRKAGTFDTDLHGLFLKQWHA